jgi:hypothetical protein
MMNILHDICVKTKNIAAKQSQVAKLQAEINQATVELALLASQCYQICSDRDGK